MVAALWILLAVSGALPETRAASETTVSAAPSADIGNEAVADGDIEGNADPSPGDAEGGISPVSDFAGTRQGSAPLFPAEAGKGGTPPAPGLAGTRPDPVPLFPTEAAKDNTGSVVLPALALLALAAVAFVLSRRKSRAGGMLQVLESTSLGPKRSVVLVRVGEEVLVLGSSEAGIALLAQRPWEPSFDQALAEAKAAPALPPGEMRKAV